LIYSRFWTKFMRDIGLVSNDEPVERLFTQGMVIKDGAKMSKSLGNIVSPEDMIRLYGADSARMYVLFAVPPDRDMDWQEDGVSGVNGFLSRVYRFVTRNAGKTGDGELNEADQQARRRLHQTLQKITADFDSRWHFNTSIAALMKLVNELYGLEASLSDGAIRDISEKLTLMLAPFAPYTAQDLWEALGHNTPAFREPWPTFDPELAKEDLAEIVIQVNGRVRGKIHIAFGTPDDHVRELALANDKVQPFVSGKQVLKVIIVPDKLVNIAVK
jgi:leucyl-tRNA synthetase